MSFCFLGRGPFSKSLLLRALLAKSYFPKLQIAGDSDCDDVRSMKKGVKALLQNNPAVELISSGQKNKQKNFAVASNSLPDRGLQKIDCGAGGAVLRFLALRFAREEGHFVFTGAPRLFERPLKELKSLLAQVSCRADFCNNQLILKTAGWRFTGDAVTLSAHRSSQFASALFLNSWNLDKDLFVSIEGGSGVSHAYLEMTLSFLRGLGMRIVESKGEYHVPAGQKLKSFFYQPEPDMSCLFVLSAMAVAGGEVVFTDFPWQSLQPDCVFPAVLEEMGFLVEKQNQNLKIKGGGILKPIERNLKNTPDLFPVLAVLCALAEGESRLYGAPHLQYKESNRIKQTAKLLKLVGRKVKVLEDGLIIKGFAPAPSSLLAGDGVGHGVGGSKPSAVPAVFDPAGDHRMAMAGAVFQKVGLPLKIVSPEVVNKSFPGFWTATDL